MSSIDLEKSARNCGRSLKVIMKNSSCGLAVLKNSITASRAFMILSFMLPLISKITPREMGASSVEKCFTTWTSLPSRMEKFSLSSPVTIRFQSSVTVTFTSTRFTSTCTGLVWFLRPASAAATAGSLAPAGFTASGGRGVIWTFSSWAMAKRWNVTTSRNASTANGKGVRNALKESSGERHVPYPRRSLRDMWDLFFSRWYHSCAELEHRELGHCPLLGGCKLLPKLDVSSRNKGYLSY